MFLYIIDITFNLNYIINLILKLFTLSILTPVTTNLILVLVIYKKILP